MRILVRSLMVGVFLSLIPSLAASQSGCNLRDMLVTKMTERYQESQIGAGLTPGGVLIEIWSSGSTWTIVRTLPNGISCFLIDGQNWFFGSSAEQEPFLTIAPQLPQATNIDGVVRRLEFAFRLRDILATEPTEMPRVRRAGKLPGKAQQPKILNVAVKNNRL